jgi:hypothetical protein
MNDEKLEATAESRALCRCYDQAAARLRLTPRPPSVVFETEYDLIEYIDGETILRHGSDDPLPSFYMVTLPSGTRYVERARQRAYSDGSPAFPDVLRWIVPPGYPLSEALKLRPRE